MFLEKILTMDSGKTLDNNGATTEMPGFQSGMLATAPLTVVLVTNHHPRDFLGLKTQAGISLTSK
jgi:hypothetical protein